MPITTSYPALTKTHIMAIPARKSKILIAVNIHFIVFFGYLAALRTAGFFAVVVLLVAVGFLTVADFGLLAA